MLGAVRPETLIALLALIVVSAAVLLWGVRLILRASRRAPSGT